MPRHLKFKLNIPNVETFNHLFFKKLTLNLAFSLIELLNYRTSINVPLFYQDVIQIKMEGKFPLHLPEILLSVKA